MDNKCLNSLLPKLFLLPLKSYLGSLIMIELKHQDYVDMHFIYGLANCKSFETKRLYGQLYLNRVQPDSQIFAQEFKLTFKKSTSRSISHCKNS